MKTSCELIYEISGIERTDNTERLQEFCDEVKNRLEHVVSVTTELANTGLRLTIQVNSIEPFNKDNFESFVFDNLVWDSTIAYFETSGERTSFNLVSKRYE